MQNLIGVTGFKNSGKDTLAKMLNYYSAIDRNALFKSYDYETLHEKKVRTWSIQKFAFSLKQIATRVTGVRMEMWEDQHFKSSEVTPQWRREDVKTWRDFLIKLGMKLREVHPDIFVTSLFSNFSPDLSSWIITDVRFPNEVETLRKKGGILIRINRYESDDPSPTESYISTFKVDKEIDNTKDLKHLHSQAKNLYKWLKKQE